MSAKRFHKRMRKMMWPYGRTSIPYRKTPNSPPGCCGGGGGGCCWVCCCDGGGSCPGGRGCFCAGCRFWAGGGAAVGFGASGAAVTTVVSGPLHSVSQMS